jgi:hypothetical protein
MRLISAPVKCQRIDLDQIARSETGPPTPAVEADREVWRPDAARQLNASQNRWRLIVPSIKYCSSAQRMLHSGRAPGHAMQLPRSLAPCPVLHERQCGMDVGEDGNRLIVEYAKRVQL